MKIRVSRNKKLVTLTFRSAKEAQLKADLIDSCFQLSSEEENFYKQLAKKRPAGIQ